MCYKKNLIALLLILTVFPGRWMMAPLRAQSSLLENRSSLVKKNYESETVFNLPLNPSLTDYEKAMLLANPAIGGAYSAWKTETRRIALAKGLPDPKINFGYFIQNIETAVGPQEYKIGIMQMIPWLGKLVVQGDIQGRKAEAAYQKLQSEIDGKLLILRQTYYDAYYLERAIDITQQNRDLVKNWEAVILSKYRTGMARHANLVKAQIEAIKLQDDLETLLARRMPLLATLEALLNRSDLVKIHVPDSLAYVQLAYIKEDILSFVLESNPNLKQMRFMHEAAEKAITRAKLNYLPDFSVGIDKIYTGDKWNTAGQLVPESGKDPLVVMGSVSIPIWFYKQSAGVGVAKYQERKAGADLENKENMVQVELEKIWFELDNAARKVILYKDVLIPKSLESLRSSEKAYIGDEIDFLNLIDAQRRYLHFMLASERAIVNHYKIRARLEALAGRTL